MSSPVSHASVKYSYPIFDAEFDPYNRGYLIVGGGGGESKTGVPNKLALLDVTSREDIQTVSELDLPSTEASPQSLASLATRNGLITYAGISSSVANKEAGKNDHFKSFEVAFPARTTASKAQSSNKQDDKRTGSGSITLLAQSKVFKASAASGKYSCQKLTRLSPVKSRDTITKRVGAITSSDGPDSEVVLFDATKSAASRTAVLDRIEPEGNAEVEDLDFQSISEDSFSVAYCTSSAVYLYSFSYDFLKSYRPSKAKVQKIYSVPGGSQKRRIRCLRWVSPKNLLILSNNENTQQASLLTLTVEDSGSSARVALTKLLPRSARKCSALDVCLLDADPASGNQQVIVAVAGQDTSIHVLSCDYRPSSGMTALKPFTVLSHVHSMAITKLAFSNFFPPVQSKTSNMSVASAPQYISLASVSISNTLVVDSIALTSTPTSPSKTSELSGKQKLPAVRWVLSSSGTEGMFTWVGLLLIGFAVLMTSIVMQRYMVASGGSLMKPLSNLGGHPAAQPVSQSARSVLDNASSATANINTEKATDTIREAAQSISKAVPTDINAAKAQAFEAVNDAVHKASKAVPTDINAAKAAAAEIVNDIIQSASAANPMDVDAARSQASQAVSEVLGSAYSAVPSAVHDATAQAGDAVSEAIESVSSAVPTDVNAAKEQAAGKLQGLLSARTPGKEGPAKVIVVRPHHEDEDAVALSVHEDGTVLEGARRFEDLKEHEKEHWKKRLADAGHWSLEEGETVLKSVLFSEYAAVVGGALRDAVLNN